MKTPLLTTVDPTALIPAPTHESREVPQEVLAAMALIRRFRLADMYDCERVIAVARTLGFEDGAAWLRANRHLYFLVLRRLDYSGRCAIEA
jgi:hypothetical protein